MGNKHSISRMDEKKFNDLLNATTDLIIMIDVTGIIIFINKSGYKWFELPIKELTGSNVFDLLSKNEINYINKILKTKKPQSFKQIKNNEIFSCNYFPVLNELKELSQIAIFINKNIIAFDYFKNKKKVTTHKLKNGELSSQPEVKEYYPFIEQILKKDIIKEQNNCIKIHDDLKQHLVGISYLLSALKKKVAKYKISELYLVHKIAELNKEAIKMISKISHKNGF